MLETSASSVRSALSYQNKIATVMLDRPLINNWLRHQRLGHVATSPAVTSPDF
jgi:hypothetical protein